MSLVLSLLQTTHAHAHRHTHTHTEVMSFSLRFLPSPWQVFKLMPALPSFQLAGAAAGS